MHCSNVHLDINAHYMYIHIDDNSTLLFPCSGSCHAWPDLGSKQRVSSEFSSILIHWWAGASYKSAMNSRFNSIQDEKKDTCRPNLFLLKSRIGSWPAHPSSFLLFKIFTYVLHVCGIRQRKWHQCYMYQPPHVRRWRGGESDEPSDESDLCRKVKTGTESGRLTSHTRKKSLVVHPDGSSKLSPGLENYQLESAPFPRCHACWSRSRSRSLRVHVWLCSRGTCPSMKWKSTSAGIAFFVAA